LNALLPALHLSVSPGQPLLSALGSLRFTKYRLGSGQGDFEKTCVEKRDLQAVVGELPGCLLQLVFGQAGVMTSAPWNAAELQPLHPILLCEGDCIGGALGHLIGQNGYPAHIDPVFRREKGGG
jgi:hypothetical protein